MAPSGATLAGITTGLMRHPIGPTNIELADVLDQMAEALVRRGEPNPYRVQAYLQAAAQIRDLDEPVAVLYGEGGREALMDLPGVGISLATHLGQFIETGRVALQDRLLRAEDPEALLASVPGVGSALARRLVAEGIRSLGDLERAAHDGTLAALDGIGPRKLEALRLQLNSILHRAARRRARRVRRQVLRISAASRRSEAAEAPESAASEPADPSPLQAVPTATIYSLFPPAAA